MQRIVFKVVSAETIAKYLTFFLPGTQTNGDNIHQFRFGSPRNISKKFKLEFEWLYKTRIYVHLFTTVFFFFFDNSGCRSKLFRLYITNFHINCCYSHCRCKSRSSKWSLFSSFLRQHCSWRDCGHKPTTSSTAGFSFDAKSLWFVTSFSFCYATIFILPLTIYFSSSSSSCSCASTPSKLPSPSVSLPVLSIARFFPNKVEQKSLLSNERCRRCRYNGDFWWWKSWSWRIKSEEIFTRRSVNHFRFIRRWFSGLWFAREYLVFDDFSVSFM